MPSAVTSWGASPASDCPRKPIVPLLSECTPVTRLNSVVFPAPFGPITATSWPGRTANETSLTARRPPKNLVTRSMASSRSLAAWSPASPRLRGDSGLRRALGDGRRPGGLAHPGRPQPLRAHQHHHGQPQAEDRQSILGVFAEHLRQDDQEDRAQDDAGNAL